MGSEGTPTGIDKMSERESIEQQEIPAIPETYRQFYIKQNGHLVDTVYSRKEIHRNDGCNIPTLIVSKSPDEIKKSTEDRYGLPDYEGYYDEEGYPQITYKYDKGLENYYLFFKGDKPIYVFDNHVHSLFAWQEAKEARILKDKIALIELDAHLDIEPSNHLNNIDRTIIKENIINDSLNIKNFLEPAMQTNLISQIFYGKHWPIPIDLSGNTSLIRNIKKYHDDHRLTEISQEILNSPLYLTALITTLKQKGYDVILDVDFDLFDKENTGQLLEELPTISKQADLITCASSPAYSNQDIAIARVKNFLNEFLIK